MGNKTIPKSANLCQTSVLIMPLSPSCLKIELLLGLYLHIHEVSDEILNHIPGGQHPHQCFLLNCPN